MALYAEFGGQILPLRSGVWKFYREPSGYGLAYKKDMTSTFATKLSSGRPKVDIRRYGRTSGMDNVKKGTTE